MRIPRGRGDSVSKPTRMTEEVEIAARFAHALLAENVDIGYELLSDALRDEVAAEGDEFSEAITVKVSTSESAVRISSIEWGRP